MRLILFCFVFYFFAKLVLENVEVILRIIFYIFFFEHEHASSLITDVTMFIEGKMHQPMKLEI